METKKAFFRVLVGIVVYLVISYILIKQTGWIVERPARYLGARDLLELYIPEHYLGLWVGTWGFPSEHLVLTSFFVLLFFNIYADRLFLKVFFALYWIWVSWSTIYMGDHYISDCFLNAYIAFLLWWAVKEKN